MSDDDLESPEVTMIKLHNSERCIADANAAIMANMGMMHGGRLQREFSVMKLKQPQSVAWDWQTMPSCPLQSALAGFDGEGGVLAARLILAQQASHFDALTDHPMFAHVQACRVRGLKASFEQLQAEDLEISAAGENAEQIERAFDTAFMLGLGQGLSMDHGNWHDLACAVAYRHSLLAIIELIDSGKISSARRALKAARSCELCRNPKEPAWDFAALAAKMEEAAQDKQGGAGEAASSSVDVSVDGGPTVSSHAAGGSSDAVPEEVPAAPVLITPALLHPLLQVICTVLECVARHATTHSLVMLRRSCRDANTWREEVPLLIEEPGAKPQRLGLACRLAKALEHQQGLRWPRERLFQFNRSMSMYDDAIDALQTKLVGRRRERLRQGFRDHPERRDAMNDVMPNVLRIAKHAKHAAELERRAAYFQLERIVEMLPYNALYPNATLAAGSELKAEDERKCLLRAIEAGDDGRALRFLVYEAGMSPGVPHGFTGTTPLHKAALVGSVPIMKVLCADGTIGASTPMPPEGQSVLDKHGMSVLGVAIQHGHVAALKWLVEECGWDLDDQVELRIVRMAFRRCPDGSRNDVRAILEHYGVSLDGAAMRRQQSADARFMVRRMREEGLL